MPKEYHHLSRRQKLRLMQSDISTPITVRPPADSIRTAAVNAESTAVPGSSRGDQDQRNCNNPTNDFFPNRLTQPAQHDQKQILI